MNSLCTCCKRKHGPRGVHYRGSCCFPSPPNRIGGPVRGGLHALLGSLARLDASSLPVVLGLCFWPAVRPAHKYGSQETQNRGGRVPLSHHPYIIRRAARLWARTNFVCILRDRWSLGPRVHLFSCILGGKWINSYGANECTVRGGGGGFHKNRLVRMRALPRRTRSENMQTWISKD